MTVVIAHRACPCHEPENSLAGIRRAAALGADVVEIDVRLSADGVPVLMHDRTTRRTTDQSCRVRSCSLERLRRLQLRASGEPIPTLAEALAALPRHLGVALDLKDPDAAPATLAEVRNQAVEARTRLWAQDLDAARWMATCAPDIEVALLRDTHSERATTKFLADATRAGTRGISAHWDVITPAFVERAHALDLRVYSWCTDLSRQAAKLFLLDGIVTDWPDRARASLGGDPR